MRTLLILAANPKGTERLRLDEEVKKIEQGLERAKNREQFRPVVKWAVTDDELRRALLDTEPEIVHFCGHGTGEGQAGTARDLVPAKGADLGRLAFENDHGGIQLIAGDALARLFELFADSVKCVVLNACDSELQADAIAQHIEYVVGMKKAIGDEAAIKFAVGFYDALGAGRDFEKAFKFGCSAIDLEHIPEHLTPVLKKRPIPGSGSPSREVSRHSDSRQDIRERMERRLKRLKVEVLRNLAKELLERDETVLGEEDSPISDLLEALREPGLDTISGLAAIENDLYEHSEREQADIVFEIIEEVTPLVIDDGRVRQLWDAIHHRNSAFFYAPDRHSSVLEVFMARADGTGMRFRHPKQGETFSDYEGEPLLQLMRKPPIGAPESAESVAIGILVDLCEGQSVGKSDVGSPTLDELVDRLAGVLIGKRSGHNKKRTLYCLHKMPTRPDERVMHEEAMELVRRKLDGLRGGGSRYWNNLPRFVFLLLAEKSEWEGLRSVIGLMLLRRFDPTRTRTAHGTNG